MRAIWGSGPNDVYAVGSSGVLLHSTGDGKWIYQESGTTADLTGIWGSGPNDIYISVNSNVILHSTGNGTWSHQAVAAGYTYDGIWGSGVSDIYAVGPGAHHSTGDATWTAQQVSSDGEPIIGIWGSSSTSIYAVGGSGTIFHSTGTGVWSEQLSTSTIPTGVFGYEDARVYVTANSKVFSLRKNGAWTEESPGNWSKEKATAVWLANANSVYVGTGSSTIFRSNGSGTWVSQAFTQTSSSIDCFGIWGTGTTNIYIAALDGIYHGTN